MAGAFHPLDWDDEYFGSLLGVKIPSSYFWTTMRWIDCSPVSGEIILMV